MRRFDASFVARHRARLAAGLEAPPPSLSAMPARLRGYLRGASEPCAAPVVSRADPAPPRIDPAAPVRVLGVDTSLRCTGLAIVDGRGADARFVDARPVPNPARRSIPECLVHIADTLESYIDEFHPDEVAMEGIFFCKNPRTALVLGHARGVVVLVCARRGLVPREYPPASVKRAATGVGSATKDQMRRMMQRLFGLPELPQEDSADALAIALAHIHERRIELMRRT